MTGQEKTKGPEWPTAVGKGSNVGKKLENANKEAGER
jgi:hypothetical protein